MHRRTALGAVGLTASLAIAGCATREPDEPPDTEDVEDVEDVEDEGELRVVADETFVRGEESPGRWLAEAFEADHPDAEIDWVTPEAGVELYVRQARQEPPIEEDVYVGLTPAELTYVDEQVPASPFLPLAWNLLDRTARVRDRFRFEDPDGRVLTYAGDYACLLYDGKETSAPDSMDELLEPAFEDGVLLQDPRPSTVGRTFLFWTALEYGDELGDYWEALWDNGARLFEDWPASYDAYLATEGSALVAHTSDRVAAIAGGADPERHRVGFPDGRGYVVPRLAAIFADTTRVALAHRFVDYLLSRPVQTELAARTYRFPGVAEPYVDRPPWLREESREPDEPVMHAYDELRARQATWLEEWTAAAEGRLDDG